VDAFLQKPVLRAELYRRLEELPGRWPSRRRPAPEAPAAPVAQLRQMRVLAAEDNKTNQLVFQKMVKGIDIELRFANNGREAVEMWQTFRPDLIFMDISMPEMDGKEAARAIRAAEAGTAHVPIVALTAHAMDGDADGILATGMDRYLTKPLRKIARSPRRWPISARPKRGPSRWPRTRPEGGSSSVFDRSSPGAFCDDGPKGRKSVPWGCGRSGGVFGRLAAGEHRAVRVRQVGAEGIAAGGKAAQVRGVGQVVVAAIARHRAARLLGPEGHDLCLAATLFQKDRGHHPQLQRLALRHGEIFDRGAVHQHVRPTAAACCTSALATRSPQKA
jgi:CheY-like chemotaxis protein